MGVGPDEIVGSMMFQRMARRLADRGLASLRLDYAGTGDSTGAVSSWSLADLGGETEQARAALETARDAIGSGPFAVAGICYGGRIALELIKDKDCVGALCMSPPVIEAAISITTVFSEPAPAPESDAPKPEPAASEPEIVVDSPAEPAVLPIAAPRGALPQRATKRKRGAPRELATKPEPAPASDKPVRGIDGLLPRG